MNVLYRKSRKLCGYILSLILVMMAFSYINVSAKTVKCSDYSGTNINANNYENYAQTVKSYLVDVGNNKFLRFQADVIKDNYYIEYYNSSFKLLSCMTVEKELEIFGGFYADKDNYYVLSGQKNPQEKDDLEVFRITKYDKDFKKISSAGLFDCNTTIPFDAGSARFVKSGKYLIIRTSHEMYKYSDGKNHQANATIQVDTENMSISVSLTDIANTGVGYVSHSFNQFVLAEDDKLIALDHGDALPRSLVMFLYHSPISSGDIITAGCQMKDVVKFSGEVGDNFTGASVGGFEYSDSSYLVAYNSVVDDSNFANNTLRDIYVAAVDKITKEVTPKIIASNTNGGSFSTPHLVKISANEFVLLWSKNNSISYVKVDGNGNKISDIISKNNVNLSDCKPIVSSNKLLWYEYKDAVCTFHSINLADLNVINSISVDNGHDFEVTKQPTAIGGYCTLTCKKCSETKEIETQSEFSVFWSKEENGSYNSSLDKNSIDVGQSLYFRISVVNLSDLNINISDTQSVTQSNNNFVFKKEGSYIITFTYKYNPLLKKAFTINVAHIDADCNNICDICGVQTTATHSFDNDCDTECNNCGFKRDTKHKFIIPVNVESEYHSLKCSCGEVSPKEKHNWKLKEENKLNDSKWDIEKIYICSACDSLRTEYISEQDNSTSSKIELSSTPQDTNTSSKTQSGNVLSNSSNASSVSSGSLSVTSGENSGNNVSSSVQISSSKTSSSGNTVGLSSNLIDNSSNTASFESGEDYSSSETISDSSITASDNSSVTTQTSASSLDTEKANSSLIVIIVIVAVVLLAIAGFLVWYFVFFKKKEIKEKETAE